MKGTKLFAAVSGAAATTLLIGAAAQAAPAIAKPAPAASGSARLQLSEWELANGLQVLFVPVHTSPVVTVQVWYHVGSKDEPPHRNGMAHMFEHMMFKGSTHVRPEEHARMIDAVGGEENAFTKEDTTTFYETLPKGYLGFALKLEAERMRNLKLIQPTVSSERQVVEEELRQNWLDNPIGRLLHEFRKLLFTVHPYHEDPIGEKADLDQVTPADCQKFYDTYYVPNNATLVLVGDLGEDEARKAVNDAFGATARAGDPPRPSAAADKKEPPQTKYQEVTEHWPSQIGVVIGGYHTPEGASPDTYALEVLSTILSDGESSRMNERLVRKDKIAVEAGGQIEPMEDPGMMLLFGAFLDPSKADAVREALLDEIEKVRKNGVTAAELSRAKNQLAAERTFSLDDVTGIGAQLGEYQYVRHDAKGFMDAPARYQAVTAADVQRVAQKYLSKDNLTIAILPPGGAEPASAPVADAKAQGHAQATANGGAK